MLETNWQVMRLPKQTLAPFSSIWQRVNAAATLQVSVYVILLCLLQPATASAELTDPGLRRLLIQAVEQSDSFQDRFEAEVWLVDMSRRLEPMVTDPAQRLELLHRIHYEAQRAELMPELVLAVIEVESRFDRFAISKAGAQGLMQVMPFWLKEIGRPSDSLFNARTNLRLGCTILRFYMDKEKGNMTRALARYNGSLGSYKYTNKVYRALDRRWSNH